VEPWEAPQQLNPLAPLHAAEPVGQVHTPLTQLARGCPESGWVEIQLLPQAPQFWTSNCRSTQAPLQAVVPFGQQMPWLQTWGETQLASVTQPARQMVLRQC
jgi:hypothetical protein